MEQEYKSPIPRILIIFGLLLLAITLVYLAYSFYINIPKNPENLNVQINNQDNFEIGNSSVRQFHPNMKFNHNKISYYIYPDCTTEKYNRMKKAFEVLSDEVGLISFYENENTPDIEVECTEKQETKISNNKDYFIAGEGGAKEIIQTGRYSIITNGTILLYSEKSKECALPNVELHELIHVFGFDHSTDKNSLMNPYLVSCDQKLDSSIITELKRLYSEENLVDLYFDKVEAVKKGRYLDFNITIRNSGSIDSENTTLTILDDEEIVETRTINKIPYGGGITLRVEYLKLIHYNPSQIVFSIDKDNKIKEIDKKNNIAEIKFS